MGQEHAVDDQALWALSEQQAGLITLDQLQALGLTRKARQLRRADGSLVEVQPGVYRVGGTPTSAPQPLLAACLSVAPHGLASHRLAAHLWRMAGFDAAPVEVVMPRHRRRHRRGFTVHESLDLRAVDISAVGLIPTTEPARTLIDLGAVAHPYRVEQALDDALHRRLVTLDHLSDRFRQVAKKGRRGVGVLRPLLEERTGLDLSPANTFELRARRLALAAGLPEPVLQHPVDLGDTTVYLDLAWPAQRLAVECDGLAAHFSAHQLRWDERRQNALVLLGWTVLRLTWVAVTREADQTRILLRRAWTDRQPPAAGR